MATDGTAPVVSKSRQTADRIIAHFKRSFDNYLNHWQEWIVPTLIAGLIVVASYMCCCLPYLVVTGPLICGFYHCAFEAYANRPVRSELLNRGMENAGSSILAFLLIAVINLLPLLLIYGAFFVLMLAMAAAAGPPGAPGAPAGPGANQQEPPPPEFVFGIVAFYLGMFVAMFLMLIWQLWFSTRTMFVLPLIAHRRMGVAAAWSASWRETGDSFWELLVLNMAAQISAFLGAYFMYVGMLLTVPFAITLRTSVYLERFGDGGLADEDASAIPASPHDS